MRMSVLFEKIKRRRNKQFQQTVPREDLLEPPKVAGKLPWICGVGLAYLQYGERGIHQTILGVPV